jgi:hypothetical protein
MNKEAVIACLRATDDLYWDTAGILVVSPRLACAFGHVGYAVWLQFNGWSWVEGAPYENILLRHPVHGVMEFYEAMGQTFVESMRGTK